MARNLGPVAHLVACLLALEARRPRWPGEVCKRCGRRNTVGYTVPDELWAKVVGEPGTIRCLTCFDEEAQAKGIRYAGAVICASEFYPVSWCDWEGGPGG